uniref:Uncharacterized protein n=1 Tax=Cacopsylla melanoneura TaxID=428564 RepID=A0A8D8LQK1_9HEMI
MSFGTESRVTKTGCLSLSPHPVPLKSPSTASPPPQHMSFKLWARMSWEMECSVTLSLSKPKRASRRSPPRSLPRLMMNISSFLLRMMMTYWIIGLFLFLPILPVSRSYRLCFVLKGPNPDPPGT